MYMFNNSTGDAPSFYTSAFNLIKVTLEFVLGLVVLPALFVLSIFVVSALGDLVPYVKLLSTPLIFIIPFCLAVIAYIYSPKFFGLSKIYETAWRAGVAVGIMLLVLSIGIASLNGQDRKSPNAAIMAVSNYIRAEAELYFDTHRASYAGFCASEEYRKTIERLDSEFDSTFVCFDAVDAYATEVPLVSGGKYYCVGAHQEPVRTNGNTIGVNDFVCDSAE